MAQKQAEDFFQQAKTQGLDAAGAAKGVQVATSDFFSRKDVVPGLGPAPQLMDAVFAATEKPPPDMAPTSQGFAPFQLLAVNPPGTPFSTTLRTHVHHHSQNTP